MTVEMHDHIHLGTDNPPTATYKVMHGTLDHTPDAPVVVERALNGKLHAHRLVDGEGGVIQFCRDQMQLKLTHAESATVLALAGTTLYYAPNYHDDDELTGKLKIWPDSLYVVRGVLLVRGVTNREPKADHWVLSFEIADDSAVT